MGRACRWTLPILVLGLGLPQAGLASAHAPLTLADCQARVLQDPDSPEAYMCFTTVARAQGQWDAAAERLEELLRNAPANDLARFALAHIEAARGRERAVELYRAAAEGFATQGDRTREILARLELAFFLGWRGDLESSEEEMAHAARVAEAAGDLTLLAAVRIDQAWAAYRRADYARAEGLLASIEAGLFPDGRVRLRGNWLAAMGAVHWATGRRRHSLACYRRRSALLHEIGDFFEEAVARSNELLLTRELLSTGPLAPHAEDHVRAVAEGALEASIAGGNRRIEASVQLHLAALADSPERSREHLRRALATGRSIDDFTVYLEALRLLARSLAGAEPRDTDEARRLLDEALDRANEIGDIEQIADSLATRALVEWSGRPVDRASAVAASFEALDAIEAIRDRQSDSTVRARTFSRWSPFYHLVARELLRPDPASRDHLERFLAVVERMRARVLLAQLAAARVDRAGGRATREAAPNLKAIQDALSDREAILSYQVDDRFEHESRTDPVSWLLVITRSDVESHALPERGELAASVELFLGLLENRDGAEGAGAARLYRDLLQGALDRLPPEVDRLVIVPDGPLHRLAFGALRPHAKAEPIGSGYRISLAPSLALWHAWRLSERRPSRFPALAVADPELRADPARDGPPPAGESTFVERDLGPLRHARHEARALARHLGGGSRVVVGGEASERLVKEAELGDYGILHFAAHAVVDEGNPERSALLLAPGADGEDGRLQFREVVELSLDGRIVVLSGCRSAGGDTLAGEGVFSLARSFFVAGAHAVIGSLWPLRDDEAEAIFEEFYRRLGGGDSLGEALRGARRSRMRAGAPTAAWSGLVLLGDGEIVPLPGGRTGWRPGWWQLAVAAFAASGAAATRGLFLYRRRMPSR